MAITNMFCGSAFALQNITVANGPAILNSLLQWTYYASTNVQSKTAFLTLTGTCSPLIQSSGVDGRYWFGFTPTSTTSCGAYIVVNVNRQIYPAALSSKWYIGFRAHPTVIAANSPLVSITAVSGGTSGVSSLVPATSGGNYFVEVIYDFVAHVVTVYSNGVLTATRVFDTGTVPSCTIGYQTGAFTNSTQYGYLNDLYTAYDAIDDPAPTGRLGAVNVITTTLTTEDPPGVFTPSSGTNLALLNRAVPFSITNPASFVTTDAHGAKVTYGINGAALAGVEGVQVDAYAFRTDVAQARLVGGLGFKDQDVATLPQEVTTTIIPYRIGNIDRNLAGTALTPDDLTNLAIVLGSEKNF